MNHYSEMSGSDFERTWYLSGPMSGYPNFNYETFENVSRYLRAIGLKIVSPHECEPEPEGLPANVVWENMMKKCFVAMEQCSGIIMLKGWPESRGARQELLYAIDNKFVVFYYHTRNKRLFNLSREVSKNG